MRKELYQTLKTKLENNEIEFNKIDVKDREETFKTQDLLTEDQILECLRYVGGYHGIETETDPDNEQKQTRLSFLETIESLEYVKARYVEDCNDEEDRNSRFHYDYVISIKRNGTPRISFRFHNSTFDAENNFTVSLYDILVSVASEALIEPSDLGYDEDSIKDSKKMKALIKHQDKLLSVFLATELYNFPQ